ncbi:hypothetical protein OG783_30040 [Streptomyces jietaisiensis]
MGWWVWLVVVVVAVAAMSGLVLWLQASRRSGTVIAVRRGGGRWGAR